MKKKLMMMLGIVALSFLAITTTVAQDPDCDLEPRYHAKWIGESPPAFPTFYEEELRCTKPVAPKKGKGGGKEPKWGGVVGGLSSHPSLGEEVELYYALPGWEIPGIPGNLHPDVEEVSGSGNDYLCAAFENGRWLRPNNLYYLRWIRPKDGGPVTVIVNNKFSTTFEPGSSDLSGLPDVETITIAGFQKRWDVNPTGVPFFTNYDYVLEMDRISIVFGSSNPSDGELAVCEYTGDTAKRIKFLLYRYP